MNISNIKRRALELSGFIWKYSLPILVGIALVIFLIVEAQRYFDRRAVEIQGAKIKQYEDGKADSETQTQILLDAFNRQHQITESTVNAVTEMNKTVSQLVINDRLQNGEIKSLSEAYRNARNPRNPNVQNKTNNIFLSPKPNRSLRMREDDILAKDRELYPGAAKSN